MPVSITVNVLHLQIRQNLQCFFDICAKQMSNYYRSCIIAIMYDVLVFVRICIMYMHLHNALEK